MTSSDIRRLLLLATVWGGSFIFIRLTVPAIGPVATVEARVLIAGLALLAFSQISGASLNLRLLWREYAVLGVLNSALPFFLISTAELRLTASMAAILNATSPLFGAIIASIWLKDPLTARKIVGIAIAMSGIVVLLGWSRIAPDTPTMLSIAASLLAAICYGLAGAYTRAKVRGASPLGMATGSQIAAAIIMAPALLIAPPHSMPSASVVACILMLALLSTALAYILYFRLVVDVGPAKALTVTFLTPIFGVIWSALFLSEHVTVVKVTACAIILTGTAFVTGKPAAHAAPTEKQPALRETSSS
jgi:drug/metabolite transporter (DMT)-like permease